MTIRLLPFFNKVRRVALLLTRNDVKATGVYNKVQIICVSNAYSPKYTPISFARVTIWLSAGTYFVLPAISVRLL